MFLLVLASPIRSRGCTCGGTGLSPRADAEEQFELAAAVFEGEIVGVRAIEPVQYKTGQSLTEFILRVDRPYKGNLGATATVISMTEGTTCGLGAQPGQHLFVYAFKSEKGLLVQPCTRTTLSANASADQRYARGEPAAADDFAAPDEVQRLKRAPDLSQQGATLIGRVEGVRDSARVYLFALDSTGDSDRTLVATRRVHSDGRFEFRYLPEGRYQVSTIRLPRWDDETLNTRHVGMSGSIRLFPGERIQDFRLTLSEEQVGSIRAIVHAPRPDPLLISIEKIEPDPFRGGDSEYVSNEGAAVISGLPFGAYRVTPQVVSEEDDREWQGQGVEVEINQQHPTAEVELSVSRRQ